jgi:hypothetical protein
MVVPMMLVVHMGMFVLQQFVAVFMIVPLGEMQPQADGHDNTGGSELQPGALAEDHERDQGADERRQREVSARPGGT